MTTIINKKLRKSIIGICFTEATPFMNKNIITHNSDKYNVFNCKYRKILKMSYIVDKNQKCHI